MRLHKGLNRDHEPDGAWLFWCPGCQCGHVFYVGVRGMPSWTFDENEEAPTFSPSLLNKYGDGRVCHMFLRNGQIQYLSDCTHELAGQTVDMVPFP